MLLTSQVEIFVISLLDNILIKILKCNLPILALFFPRPIAQIWDKKYEISKRGYKSYDDNPYIEEIIKPKDQYTNKVQDHSEVVNK